MLIEHTQKLDLDITRDQKGLPPSRIDERATFPIADLRGVMRKAAQALIDVEYGDALNKPSELSQEFLAQLNEDRDLQRKARTALCKATPRLSLRDFVRRMARHFHTALEVQAAPGDRVLIVQTQGDTQRTSWTKRTAAKVVAVHEIEPEGNVLIDLHMVARTQRTTGSTAGGLARGTCSFAALVVRPCGTEFDVVYAQVLPDVWSAHTRGHYGITIN